MRKQLPIVFNPFKVIVFLEPGHLAFGILACIDFYPFNGIRQGNLPVEVGKELPRERLVDNINQRVDTMMTDGLLAEVEGLLPFQQLNALQTVGYKELFAYFEQTISLDQAVALIKQHSRNYAKRQITWFKNDEGCTRFEPTEIEKIKSFVEIVLQHS